jgi:hypothetical protein
LNVLIISGVVFGFEEKKTIQMKGLLLSMCVGWACWYVNRWLPFAAAVWYYYKSFDTVTETPEAIWLEFYSTQVPRAVKIKILDQATNWLPPKRSPLHAPELQLYWEEWERQRRFFTLWLRWVENELLAGRLSFAQSAAANHVLRAELDTLANVRDLNAVFSVKT